jgi:glycosyltransferase involved in cell wall biosynthesis
MYEVPSIVFPLYKDYRFALPTIKPFEEYLKEFKPDIIHINSPCPLGCAAIKYGEKFNIPVAATYHTHFVSYAKYYNVKILESLSWNYFRSLYNRCETVFVPSIPIMKELEKHGLNNVQFLSHGVDLSVFNPEYKNPDWKISLGIENKTVLLFVGRLVWEKDLKTLAEAYKIIASGKDDVAFVLVGDGPIKNELKELMPAAKFLGYKTGKELSTAFASSDIFVFPSTTETFGNVTLEAMASGIPAVCVKEGGAYGFIQDGINGLIANPRDAKDFAEKIIFLADNFYIRKEMAFNSLSFAREQTWDKIFERLFESYLEIINDYKSGIKFNKNYAA